MSLYNYNRDIISSGGSGSTDSSKLPIRLRVLDWNIGSFGAGRGSTIVSSSNAEAVALKYKNLFNGIAPDIIGINEYTTNFTTNGDEQVSDYIFSAFNQQFVVKSPHDSNFSYSTIFLNGINVVKSYKNKILPNGYGTGRRTYYCVICNIKGKTVYVVQTHLTWQNDTSSDYPNGLRVAEINELIRLFSSKDYVILMGDFNVSKKEEFTAFTDAGFTLVSGGYTGYMKTAPANGCLDNIIVKGFEPMGMYLCTEAAEITNGATNATGTKLHAEDHLPLYTDLQMLEVGNTEIPVKIPTTHNVENLAVSGFMSKTYPDGYSIGNGETYINEFLHYIVENTIPSWTEISNPLVIGSCGQVVKLTLNNKTVEYSGGQPIYNLIPKEIYTCQVLDKNGNELAKGSITTTGTVRMIMMTDNNSIVNMRDIGGYSCTGGYMSYGKIFRSAYIPDSLSSDDDNVKILKELGITSELNLAGGSIRTDLGFTGYSFSASDYANIISNPINLRNELLAIISDLSNGKGILMHCYAGADRTGTLAAILQLMCGVSESDVIHDWEMTSFCCWWNAKRIEDGDLRGFFRALNAYTGNTWQNKVTNWLINEVNITESEITTLKNYLITKK